jgi:sarcosine oxidase subunit beta
MAGVSIPSRPYRRQVMVTEPLPVLPPVFPLIVDLDTGFYVHRQGQSAVLMGGTDKDIKPGLDTEVDWDAFGAVFRAAAVRVPPLAEARVMRAYAGVRDLTPDYHGILGPAVQAPGLHVACGFSCLTAVPAAWILLPCPSIASRREDCAPKPTCSECTHRRQDRCGRA